MAKKRTQTKQYASYNTRMLHMQRIRGRFFSFSAFSVMALVVVGFSGLVWYNANEYKTLFAGTIDSEALASSFVHVGGGIINDSAATFGELDGAPNDSTNAVSITQQRGAVTDPDDAEASKSMLIYDTKLAKHEWTIDLKAGSTNNGSTPANLSVIFNYENADTYWYANFAAQNGDSINGIFRVTNGEREKVDAFNQTIEANKVYDFKLRKRKGEVKAFINNDYLTKVDDSFTGSSYVGIGTLGANAAFYYLEIDERKGADFVLFDIDAPETAVTEDSSSEDNDDKTPDQTPPSTGEESTPPKEEINSSNEDTPAHSGGDAPVSDGDTIRVSNGQQLTQALVTASAGDTIVLADGTYKGDTSLNGIGISFGAVASGTTNRPITLKGSRDAVIQGNGTSSDYGLYLLGANNWRLEGFTIRSASKGLVLDRSNNVTIDNLRVEDIGWEAVHFRAFSSDNVIKNSLIQNTGKVKPQYGEGVYIGSAKSNWGKYSGGKPDTSDNNKVINNTIRYTGAESIDIKEGTTGGLIQGNSFNGAGMSGQNYADSWIDVKGNDYVIKNNTGVNAFRDGIQIHRALSGWGNGNVFMDNSLQVNASGYGFTLQSGVSGNMIYCNNAVSGASKGFSNTGSCI